MAVQTQRINFKVDADKRRITALIKKQGLSMRVAGQGSGRFNFELEILDKNRLKDKKSFKKIRNKLPELISWINIGIFVVPYFPAIVEFVENFLKILS